jgi:O-antigen/teichoic acid export membrane protein
MASFLCRSLVVARQIRTSQVLNQVSWLAVAKIVQGVASLVASLVVARALGPKSFGELSLAISIASFVATAASLGLEHIAMRELALKDDRIGGNTSVTIWRLRIFGAIAGCFILFFCASLPRAWGIETNGLLWILCLLPLCQIGDFAEWSLIARGQSRIVAVVTL